MLWFHRVHPAPSHITSSFIWAMPLPRLLHCPVFIPAPAWKHFSPLQTNVTIPCHLSHYTPCEKTPSTNLGIVKVMSAWVFVILTRYSHIGYQRGRVPMQVRAGRPGSERGVGGVRPSRMKMWSNPECAPKRAHKWCSEVVLKMTQLIYIFPLFLAIIMCVCVYGRETSV
jgi:hypothetical protein